MADSKELQQIVEHAVAQVFDRQLPKLQAELVARYLLQLTPEEQRALIGRTPTGAAAK